MPKVSQCFQVVEKSRGHQCRQLQAASVIYGQRPTILFRPRQKIPALLFTTRNSMLHFCVSTIHKKCDLTALDEIVKTSKTSALFYNLEHSLKDLKENIKRITKDREQNLSKVHQSREKIQSEIKTMRDKINKHLDSIEQKILQDLGDVEKGVNSEIQHIHNKLLEHTKTVEDLEVYISAIKKYASDLQIFVGMKKVETDIEHAEKFVMSLLEDGSLQQVDIDFKMDHKLFDILSIKGYGNISRTTSSSAVVMKTEKNKQAQYLVAPSRATRTINDINISSHRKVKIPKNHKDSIFTGCTIRPTGQIVLVDWNYADIFIFNESESLECKIKVSRGPVDVTCIDEKTIAISHDRHPFQIEIMNLSSKQIQKQIKTSNSCRGITNIPGRLIYCTNMTGIQSVDFSGDNASIIVKEPEMFDCYVTASECKLYYTNSATNTVTCYNITGEKVWEYNDTSVLKDVYGVTTDTNDNVYVASSGNNSIVVISPDGKHARRLIGEEDGLDRPLGVYLDKTRNNLLISCYGDVHMYKVS